MKQDSNLKKSDLDVFALRLQNADLCEKEKCKTSISIRAQRSSLVEFLLCAGQEVRYK